MPSTFLTIKLSEFQYKAVVLNPSLKGWIRSSSLQRHQNTPEPLHTAVYGGRKSSFSSLLSTWNYFILLYLGCLFHKCHFLCIRKYNSLKITNLLPMSCYNSPTRQSLWSTYHLMRCLCCSAQWNIVHLLLCTRTRAFASRTKFGEITVDLKAGISDSACCFYLLWLLQQHVC